MPIYWVFSYGTKPDKMEEYRKWLTSNEAKGLMKKLEQETGFRYINSYIPILGVGGDNDFEDWFEVPNWAAADKIRDSKAYEEIIIRTWYMIDNVKGVRARVLRTAEDINIPMPP